MCFQLQVCHFTRKVSILRQTIYLFIIYISVNATEPSLTTVAPGLYFYYEVFMLTTEKHLDLTHKSCIPLHQIHVLFRPPEKEPTH